MVHTVKQVVAVALYDQWPEQKALLLHLCEIKGRTHSLRDGSNEPYQTTLVVIENLYSISSSIFVLNVFTQKMPFALSLRVFSRSKLLNL